jgi:hypothetical protein
MPQAARAAVAALRCARLPLLFAAGSASAATDHVVITGGAMVPAGRTAGDIVVLDGTVRIAGRVAGDVVSVSGPVRAGGRVHGDLTAVVEMAGEPLKERLNVARSGCLPVPCCRRSRCRQVARRCFWIHANSVGIACGSDGGVSNRPWSACGNSTTVKSLPSVLWSRSSVAALFSAGCERSWRP